MIQKITDDRIMKIAILLLSVLLGFQTTVEAWWDGGHLLVASVAKQTLDDATIDILEAPLWRWEDEYPGFSSLVTSAVWADHIKCGHSAPYCGGMEAFDSVELFNTWHYINQVYNPQNITIRQIYNYLPFPATGAVWALSGMLESLTGRPNWPSGEGSLSPFPNSSSSVPNLDTNKSVNNSRVGVRENRHVARSSEGSEESSKEGGEGEEEGGRVKKRLSTLAWNLQMRLLIHIFGDLHQPLHSIETFSHMYPGGDLGGNQVHLDLSESGVICDPQERAGLRSLHQLWDSCGGLYSVSWPVISEKEIQKEALKLMSKYPESYFDRHRVTGINTFYGVAKDSYRVAMKEAYSDFDWSKPHAIRLPYQPSDEYIRHVRDICQQQIVLGGYRLGLIFKSLAKVIGTNTNWTGVAPPVKRRNMGQSLTGTGQTEKTNQQMGVGKAFVALKPNEEKSFSSSRFVEDINITSPSTWLLALASVLLFVSLGVVVGIAVILLGSQNKKYIIKFGRIQFCIDPQAEPSSRCILQDGSYQQLLVD